MSKLEELIQQYCPDGVEWKTLAECCNILDGKRKPITKGARQSGSYPYYGANGIQDWVADYIFDGTYVLIGEDGSVITPNGTPIVNWAHGKIWVNNHAHIIAEKTGVLLRFLFYYIQIIDIHNLVHGNIPKLTQGDLKELEIPVPPLPVQEEIVRILDTFTELQAELQAELQKRLQQYNYYRDNLLTNFTNEREPKEYTLEEATIDIYSGATPSKEKKDYWENGTIPWMSSGEVNLGQVYEVEGRITQLGYDKCSTKMVPEGSVVIALAGQGKTRGTVAILRTSVCTNQSLAALIPNTKIVSGEYLYHYLKTQYSKLREVSAGDGTRGGLNLKMLRAYKVVIPPLEEQNRIVSILDRFDSLTNDLTAGLPAEIEKRRQQYEYYRDKLLTFKRKAA